MLGEEALRDHVAHMDSGGVLIILVFLWAARAGVVQIATEPAFALERLAVAGRLPDLGRAEVAPVRVGEADVLDDGKIAVIVKPVELFAGGVEGKVVVEVQQALAQAEAGAEIVVAVVGVRHNGIEPVIAARQLNDDEDAAVALGAGRLRHRALSKEGRRETIEGEEAEAAPGTATNEFTASQW